MPVLFERRGHVGLVTLSRPEARNAWCAEFDESLRAGLAQQAAEQKEAEERIVTAAKHRDWHQPMQDLTQQQAAAMSQIFDLSRQTSAVAAELRESNRDQRNFLRSNEEQVVA